jgi:hypothetical protein
MIIPRLLVILTLLWLTAPGYGYEVSVSQVQDGSIREPLDVGKTVTYDVTVSGVSNSMRYTFDLTVGPDSSDPSISKDFQTEVNVKSGSGTVQFPVNFQAPDLRRGEFGLWLADRNRTDPWEKAWYRVSVTSLNPFEKPMQAEDYTGKPALIKVSEEFRDAQVTPRKGTRQDRYDYQVSVFSTIQDNITLEIGPGRSGPWSNMGSRDYTTPGTWATLQWKNVSLGFDFTSAAYRISGRKQVISDGPSWPLEVEFNNSSVIPRRGLSDMPFTYSIDVRAEKAVDVGLNAWDVSNKRYSSAGRLSYTNASEWQTLTWREVQPSLSADSSGESNYYFSFFYPGSDNPFTTTYEKEGKYYPGPVLSIASLGNWSVVPRNGTIFTPYNYSVQVETRLPSFDIELQTSAPGSGIWTSKGTAAYDGRNSTFVWRNVSFDPNSDVVGNGSYRFMLGEMLLGEFTGPDIDVAFKDMIYQRIGNTDRFDYRVKIKSASPGRKIELIYTDDGLVWTRSGQIQEYESNSQEWQELVWKNQPWHKTIRFDVLRNGR